MSTSKAILYFRLHFSPMEDYDSTNALFNGALLGMPSEDMDDTMDPIIDIIPDNIIPQGYTPIVTSSSLAPSADNMLLGPSSSTLTEPLLTIMDTGTSTTSSTIKNNMISSNRHETDGSDSSVTPAVSAQTTVIDIENEFESHQKHLHALKVG